jgi:hypothetical protein
VFERSQNINMRRTSTKIANEVKYRLAETQRGIKVPTSRELLAKFKFDPLMDPK